MFPCPNCTGALLFDIETQMMKCEHCESLFHPFSLDEKNKDAKATEMYDVTTYVCPQCNGEINSTENLVATFCVYCGSPVTMIQKMGQNKKPDYIIPFMKTKAQCMEAYKKNIQSVHYVPKEMKNPKLENFVGIYMPYWMYSADVNKMIRMRGASVKRKSGKIISQYYLVEGEWRVKADGIVHDASSSFSDELSEKIAPFDMDGKKEFHAGYLSGFYADTEDVSKDIYAADAADVICDSMSKEVESQLNLKDFTFESSLEQIADDMELKEEKMALMPIWFMAFKNKDRVSYAAINGQTGRVATDMPVDMKKYFFGSVAMAIPIFLILSMLFFLRPMTLLAIIGGLTTAVLFVHSKELKEVIAREKLEYDRGKRKWRNKVEARNVFGKKKSNLTKKKFDIFAALGEVLFVLIMIFLEYGSALFSTVLYVMGGMRMGGNIVTKLGLVAMSVFTLYLGSKCRKSVNELKYTACLAKSPLRKGYLGACLAIILLTVVSIWNPVDDSIFYISAVVAVGLDVYTLFSMMRYYDIISSRKLPFFERTDIGGNQV